MRSRAVLPATMLVVFWSSGFVGATLATRCAPFVTVLAWRTIVAALALGLLAVLRRERIPVRELPGQLVLGLLVQGVYLGGVFAAAQAGVPAGTTALIAALQPLVVAAVAGPLLGARPSGRQVAGLLLGASGVSLVVAGDLGATSPVVFLLPVVAVLGLSGGTVLESRLRPDVPVVASLAVQSAVAATLFALASGLRGELAPPPTAAFWSAIAWLVVLAAMGGYGSYLYVLRASGPTVASTLLLLTPPATALWAWVMFAQTPGPLAVPGVAVCAAGVGLFVTAGAVTHSRTSVRAMEVVEP